MSDEPRSVTRRGVLRSAAGAVPAAGLSGLATADGDGVDKYNVGYSAESGRTAARDAASEVVREYNFDALTVRLPRRAVSGLRSRSDVRYVEENVPATLHGETLPWGVDRIDADLIRGIEDGSGVGVAVLDTGVDTDHLDLDDNVAGTCFAAPLCTDCDRVCDDDEGHGTSVAGIVGAENNTRDVVGVAPEVTVVPVKVCDSTGDCDTDDVASGLEWAADEGHEVANISLGWSDHQSVIDDAVDYAAGKDVLMVASAGNDGPCTDCVNYPARDDLVVAVSAIDSTEDLWDDSSQGPEVELTAPTTVETTALGGGTTFFGGTSAAAPHVSGSAALIRARVPTQNVAERQLFDEAEDVGLSSNEQGHGLVDAEAAVEQPLVVTGTIFRNSDSTELNGDLQYFGDAASADVYFEWGEENEGLPNETTPETLSSTGSFSTDVPTACETYYEFRAVAEASDGDVDTGEVKLFLSQDCDTDCGDKRTC